MAGAVVPVHGRRGQTSKTIDRAIDEIPPHRQGPGARFDLSAATRHTQSHFQVYRQKTTISLMYSIQHGHRDTSRNAQQSERMVVPNRNNKAYGTKRGKLHNRQQLRNSPVVPVDVVTTVEQSSR